MKCHDGMHLLYQGIKTIQTLGANGMLLHGEANTLVIRASSDTLSPRHARHPINGMKRQTNYIIVIDISSWRSEQDLTGREVSGGSNPLGGGIHCRLFRGREHLAAQ
jgi:hypothetical protein